MTNFLNLDREGRGLGRVLPVSVRPGSEAWRWAATLARSLRVALGVTGLVGGTGLAGKGIALCLYGIGLSSVNLPQPDHEALAAGLAIAMIGGAIIGLAAETAFRSPSQRPDAAPWETTVTWIPALLIALWIAEQLESLAALLLPPFSELFNLVPAYLNEVGNRGLLAGPAGIALMWLALQFGAPRYPLIGDNSPALLYACWMALVIINY